jgi:tRNA dimethylallyltransferase
MMQKLLVVVGPTATGKTKLAIQLSKLLNGEIVSADSRQVYKDLDIGTGKEYSSDPNVPIWGYDIVGPNEDFSVSQFAEYAEKTIEDIVSRNKLPILVGGTGLYIKAVVDGIETAGIPQDKNLRDELATKDITELLSLLDEIDPPKANSLNNSDRQNPRRLIRAIEIAKSGKRVQEKRVRSYDALFVGLTAPREVLFDKVALRVRERVAEGVKDEIQSLIDKGVLWDDQAMTSLGYRQWKHFFHRKASEEETIEEWIHEEEQYVKRQITWFQKDKRIHWFDKTSPDFEQNVVQLCQDWIYNAKKS